MTTADELVSKDFLVRIKPAKDLADKEWVESEYDLKEAEHELAGGGDKWATVKSYYAMFHAAKAVLFLLGLKERSHYAVGETLDALSKQGRIESNYVNDFSAARNAREGADYKYAHTEAVAEQMVGMAEEFIKRMKTLAKNL